MVLVRFVIDTICTLYLFSLFVAFICLFLLIIRLFLLHAFRMRILLVLKIYLFTFPVIPKTSFVMYALSWNTVTGTSYILTIILFIHIIKNNNYYISYLIQIIFVLLK